MLSMAKSNCQASEMIDATGLRNHASTPSGSERAQATSLSNMQLTSSSRTAQLLLLMQEQNSNLVKNSLATRFCELLNSNYNEFQTPPSKNRVLTTDHLGIDDELQQYLPWGKHAPVWRRTQYLMSSQMPPFNCLREVTLLCFSIFLLLFSCSARFPCRPSKRHHPHCTVPAHRPASACREYGVQ